MLTIHFAELGNFKDRFEKGMMDEESSPKHKTAVDVRCAELGNIKSAFEEGKFRKSEEVRIEALICCVGMFVVCTRACCCRFAA
jgi:hypothetical protein